MSKPFINSAKMGLLGGLGEYFKVMEKYNAIRQQNEARLNLVKTKSDAMERMNAMRAQATKAARLAAAEANQKIEYTHPKNDDGSYDTSTLVGTKWHIDPDNPDGPPIRTEVDRKKDKTANKQLRVIPDKNDNVAVEFDPSTGEATEMSRGSRFNPNSGAAAQAAAAAARQQFREGSLNARTAEQENNRRDREVEKAVEAASKEWRDPALKTAMLAETGVDPKDPNARQKVLDAVREKKKGDLPHVAVPKLPDANIMNPGNAQQPQDPTSVLDQNGHPRPVRYDTQGRAYMKGPDGKPVPVTINAKGVAVDAPPLALDTMGSAGANVAMGGGGDNYDDEDAQNAQDDERMMADEPDDDEDDQASTGQGLMGSYA